MEITKENIETLKKQHGEIYQARLTYKDKNKKEQAISFVYRPLTVEEVERSQTTAQKLATVANLQLLESIIVHNHEKDAVEELRDLPGIVGQFIQNEVIPFLGELQSVETAPL